jgi:preprotein translocase subunit SecA/nephrocystin-3
MLDLNNDIASRTIRVFLSSTFRDMQVERTHLIRQVFPHLHHLARLRGVDFTEVDLRWGIPEEESKSGKVVRRCLGEIDVCREKSKELPFFIGLIGGRYGWVPTVEELAGDEHLTRDFSDVGRFLSARYSVTEMEMRHAVLEQVTTSPDVRGQSYFFFRDPAYTETLKRQNPKVTFTDADDSALKEEEKAHAAVMLPRLRELICNVMADRQPKEYHNVEELGTEVTEAFEKFLKDHFPFPVKDQAEDLDPEQIEKARQQEEERSQALFARSRMQVYRGGEKYYSEIDALLEQGKPVLVTGGVGSGKTALLANYIARWQKAGKAPVIYHFCGGTRDSDKLDPMLHSLIVALRLHAHSQIPIPDHSGGLSFAMAQAIWSVPSGVPLLLVIDGLDQLDRWGDLRWLPQKLPTHVSLVIGLKSPVEEKDHELAGVLESRGFVRVRVGILTPEERQEVISVTLLSRYGKSMSLASCRQVAASPIAENPLVLRALIEEIRLFGEFETLGDQIKTYLSTQKPEQFFDAVVNRIAKDLEGGGKVMALIGASRDGLTENEILGLMNLESPEGEKFPVMRWSALHEVLRPHLKEQDGSLTWFHDMIRKSASRQFLADSNKVRDLRLQMVEYEEKQPVTLRSTLNLLWLLEKLELPERLQTCLLDVDRFRVLFEGGRSQEVQRHWLRMGEDGKMGPRYLDSFRKWESAEARSPLECAQNAHFLGVLLSRAAQYKEAEILLLYTLELREKEPPADALNLALTRHSLANLYSFQGRYGDAEPLFLKALDTIQKIYDPHHPFVASCLQPLGLLYRDMGRYAEAESLLRRALKIGEITFGEDHPDVVTALNSLGMVCIATPDGYGEAEILFRRALFIAEKQGKDDPLTVFPLNNLGYLLYLEKHYSESESLSRKALEVAETTFGTEDLNAATSRNNLGELYRTCGRHAEAEKMHRTALAIREKILPPDHPDIAQSLNNSGLLLYQEERYAEAEPLLRRALKIREKIFLPDHPDVVQSLSNLAVLCSALKYYEEAERLHRRALSGREKRLGKNHSDVADSLIGLYVLCHQGQRYEEAECLLHRALEIWEVSLGENHPNVQICRQHLAALRQRRG